MAQIFIDGKPLEETIWTVDGVQYTGTDAIKKITLIGGWLGGAPLALISGIGGYWLGKRK